MPRDTWWHAAISQSRSDRATSSGTRGKTSKKVTTDARAGHHSARELFGRGASTEEASRSSVSNRQRTGQVGRRAARRGRPAPPLLPQGFSRSLVVPARRNRPLLLHRPAAFRSLPLHLVQAVHGGS